MKLAALSPRLLAAALLVSFGIASCFAEPSGMPGAGGKQTNNTTNNTGGSANVIGGAPDAVAGMPALPACYARPVDDKAECRPVKSAEPYLARLVEGVAHDQTIFVDDLFTGFKAHCGGCHVSNKLGDFQVSRTTFSELVDEKVLAAIKSDSELCELGVDGKKVDPKCFDYMPPAGAYGKAWSDRLKDPGDPLRPLVAQLEAWIAAGRPADQFLLPADPNAPAPYTVDDDLARSMTHLGTCTPDAGLVATELDKSCALDSTFATAAHKPDGTPEERIGLPPRLDQTDLFTYDSAELARHGVIAYVPTYPLWTDDAGKLRHVRVPRGYDADGKPLAIHFNAETKQFEIPDNTRFYKTFMAKVRTQDGSQRWRKIETRLIVARANNQSLFGTYEWNSDETDATLVIEPLRNGEPFADKLKTLVIDEAKDADIHARFEAGEFGKYANLTYQEDKAHVLRRYAIPGSSRCIQCHMGSPSQTFVLGFSPLQIGQRPCSAETLEEKGHCEGGLLNATAADEVNQLQRLIDYGIITDYDPKVDLVKLEDEQGTRKAPRAPRGEEELAAQAYLLGNCAHCHNPNGYASIENPELRDLLDFLPSERGGIFQFPLERYSPRIKRGLNGALNVPYITPHLYDKTAPDEAPKVVGVPDPVTGELTNVPIPAPWRSLIYRNTDTPFTYTDDSAIYPHMPLNMPGYDCRVAHILGDWMVSIPAVLKDYSQPLDAGDMQAVVEVTPDKPNYLAAVAEKEKRMKAWRAGQRYKYCPDTSDIIDIDVLRGKRLIPQDHTVATAPTEGVPDRPHWVVTDLTDPPPPWNPRRPDWESVLGPGGQVPPLSAADMAFQYKIDAWNSQVQAVGLDRLASISSALEKFATTPLEFALWEPNQNCKFDHATKLGEAQAKPNHPRWMDQAKDAGANAPVYETLPGAAVFNMICVNCHGPDADSGGRQASTLQEMTGGIGRVANFRDGFFGPYGEHGANRSRVFGHAGETDAEKATLGEEWAARYLAWMALGGTTTPIPSPILSLVAQTPVAGVSRPTTPSTTTANMLQVAQGLCHDVAMLGTDRTKLVPAEMGTNAHYLSLFTGSNLIFKNGDAELWAKLCAFDNPVPVRVYHVEKPAGNDYGLRFTPDDFYCSQKYEYTSEHFHCSEGYPAGTKIGNAFGGVDTGVTPDNIFPWCVAKPTKPEDQAWLDTQKTADGHPIPVCPDAYLATEERNGAIVPKNRLESKPPSTRYGIDAWATRGAINAGFAVFLYLRDFIGEGKPRAYRFNECELFERQLGNP